MQSLLDLFNKSMDDIFVEWESFNITEVKEDLDLNLSNLIRFQGYLQTKLAKNSTPVSKRLGTPLDRLLIENNSEPWTIII